MSVCRSCGAPVMWVTTLSGKSMPVDAEPVDDGTVVVDGDRARVVTSAAPAAPGQPAYTSHFATCPQSRVWRR